jgi:phosphate transport system permease protein
MKGRRFVEKISEGLLFGSSMVTTVTVLFIIYFLVKSGIGLFFDKPVDSGHALALPASNPIQTLTAQQIKEIFNGEITNWKEVGWTDASIELLTLDELASFYTEEELGSNFERVPVCVQDYLSRHSYSIVYLDKSFFPASLNGHYVEVPRISLKDFFGGKEWYPTAEPAALFGLLPLLLGTLWVTFLAILIALPIGLITAIYMAEIASERMRQLWKPVIELLAGIPSVVYGFFGLVILVPFIQRLFQLPVGETA